MYWASYTETNSAGNRPLVLQDVWHIDIHPVIYRPSKFSSLQKKVILAHLIKIRQTIINVTPKDARTTR